MDLNKKQKKQLDTARKKLTALKQQLAGSPRFAVQEALLPYARLLPERFRGRNERIDEMFPNEAAK